MITITEQPEENSLQAAYQPITYRVQQSGVTGALPPALRVAVVQNGNTLPAYEINPDRRVGPGTYEYVIDLSGHAARTFERTPSVPSPNAPVLRVAPGAVVEMSVGFTSFAAGADGLITPTGDTADSDTCFVIDAYRRGNDFDLTLDEFADPGRPRFLTRRPRIMALGLLDREVVSLYHPEGGATISVAYAFFRADGSEIRTATRSFPGDAGNVGQFPYAPGDITPLGLGGLDEVAYYQVRALSGATVGDTITVHVERGIDSYASVYFYNSFGAWEQALFSSAITQQYTLSGETYARGQRTRVDQRSSRWRVDIESHAATADEIDALLDLANAPLIYLTMPGSNRQVEVLLDARVLPVALGLGSNAAQPFAFTFSAAAATESQRSY